MAGLMDLSFNHLTQPLGSGSNSYANANSNFNPYGNLYHSMMSGSSPNQLGAFNSNPVGSMPNTGMASQDTYRRQLLLQQLQQQNANLPPVSYYTSPKPVETPPVTPSYVPWEDYRPGLENRMDWNNRMIGNQKAAGVYREQKINYTPQETEAYRQQLENAGVLMDGRQQDIIASRIAHGLPGFLDPMRPTWSHGNIQRYGIGRIKANRLVPMS